MAPFAVTEKATTPCNLEGQKPGTSGLRSKENIHVDLSEVQDNPLDSLDGTDSGLTIDPDANHAVQTPTADVGFVSRFRDFLVFHIKRVQEIVRAGCTGKIHVELQDIPLDSENSTNSGLAIDLEANHGVKTPAAGAGHVSRASDFLVNHIKQVYPTARAGFTAFMVHCTAADDQMEEQQKRCYEYSKKALVSEGCTLAAYFLSPVPLSVGRSTLFITMTTLFLAMITDVISLKTKPKWGRALVYMSSFLQMLTTFLMFISLDKAYGYAFISVPLLIFVSIGSIFFQREQQLYVHDKVYEGYLDGIFDFSALILNSGALITTILCKSMEDTDTAASIIGFFFIFIVILSLYLMMVTTLRDVALTLLATYLDYSLAALLFGTLIATIISFTTEKKM